MASKRSSIIFTRLLKFACISSTPLIMISVFLFFAIYNAFQGNIYLTASNISVIINQACFLTIIGVGQALVILTGGINLSIGSVMALTTVMWGRMLMQNSTVHFVIPIALIIITGMLIGLINGILITKLRLPPFIATFAVMYACRGLAWVMLGKKVIYRLNDDFRIMGMGIVTKIGDFAFTVPMLIVIVILLVCYFVLTRTSAGKKLYFTGANPVAARFSGLNVNKITIYIYMISTGMAAFAGLMYIARLNACEPGMALKAHFESITVALIGGFAMSGGFGNIWGVAGGAIIVSTIQNGMNSIQVSPELQTLVMGVLIIIAVTFNQFLMNKSMTLTNELDVKKVPNKEVDFDRK